MYLLIETDETCSLQEIDNLNAFSIVEAVPGMAARALASIAVPASADHYWLDADAVVNLSPKASDSLWVDAFWQMLAKVEVYGYANLAKKQLKAHVEQQR